MVQLPGNSSLRPSIFNADRSIGGSIS
ncbi:uncharacterized protein METZ01_LOCUS111617 [marine metagenome]|uniref:Uncharacterized protein n=1 Tax=marine metagenome TaxID=408172 RepID=A0A381X3F5_9ZZZZ